MKYFDKKILRIVVVILICLGGTIILITGIQKNTSRSNEEIKLEASTDENTTSTVDCEKIAEKNDIKQEDDKKSTDTIQNNDNEKVNDDNVEKGAIEASENKEASAAPKQFETSTVNKEQSNTKSDLIPASKTIVLQGFIIDEDCFVSYSDPSSETRGCLNMAECAASGYGIAVKEDGKYKFYYFDGQISGLSGGKRIENATGGQKIAWDFIDSSISDKNIMVTITAELTDDYSTNPSSLTADGIKYPVIKVTSITKG